jgi:hypothetical protein
MVYSSSRNFAIRRFLYGLSLIGVLLASYWLLEMSDLFLLLIVIATLSIVARLASELVRPTSQIILSPIDGEVQLRHVALLGGWRSEIVAVGDIKTVDTPSELGSLSAERLDVPHIIRPLMRAFDLYEIRISTSQRSYIIAGRRTDLLHANAIGTLRSLVS